MERMYVAAVPAADALYENYLDETGQTDEEKNYWVPRNGQRSRSSASVEDRSEARAELDEEIRSYLLAELRRHLSITQEDLAAALNVNQPAVSKLEQADMSLSRLRNAVEALGGELEVGVRINGVLFPLELLERESA